MNKLEFKTLTLDELKQDYSTRLGFVFKAKVRSSDEAIENLCNVLISYNVARELPEFVNRVGDNIVVFVYGDDFDSPAFFEYADMAQQMMRAFQVASIVNALK